MCRGTSGLFLISDCVFFSHKLYNNRHTHPCVHVCIIRKRKKHAPGDVGGEAEGPEAVERMEHPDVRIRGGAGEDQQLSLWVCCFVVNDVGYIYNNLHTILYVFACACALTHPLARRHPLDGPGEDDVDGEGEGHEEAGHLDQRGGGGLVWVGMCINICVRMMHTQKDRAIVWPPSVQQQRPHVQSINDNIHMIDRDTNPSNNKDCMCNYPPFIDGP